MRPILPFPAIVGIAFFVFAIGAASAASEPPAMRPPLAASDLLLAQALPVATEASSVPPDTAVAAPPTATPRASLRRRGHLDLSREELLFRRDRAAQTQRTGFGLMMGGIGAGAGGLVVMIMALNNLETHTDRYGYEEKDIPGYFMLGFISLVYVCPPLLATGIAVNRVGNHRRVRYERWLEEEGGARLDIAPNGLRLSYTF